MGEVDPPRTAARPDGVAGPHGARATGPARPGATPDGAPWASGLPVDALDLLDALHDAGARYLLIGGHALAVHGVSRSTLDVDLFVAHDAENADRVFRALIAFGAPVGAHALGPEDLRREGTVYQMGLPPRRIDILTGIDGVGFEEAWADRLLARIDGRHVPVIGRGALLRNKSATGRAQGRADVEALLAASSRGESRG